MKLAFLTVTCLIAFAHFLPFATTSFIAIDTSSILGIISTIVKTGLKLIEDRSEINLPISLEMKEKKILERISILDKKITEIGHSMTNSKLEMVSEIVSVLTRTIKVELRFNDLLQYIDDIDYTYSFMQEYSHHKDSIDRSTLEDYAKSVISHSSSSVRMRMERIHRFVVPKRKYLGHSSLIELLAGSKVRINKN